MLCSRTENGERFIASFDKYLLCSASWHKLCLGVPKWARQAWLLSSGRSLLKATIPSWQGEEETYKSQARTDGGRADIPEEEECIWNLQDGRGQHSVCGDLSGTQAEEERWDTWQGPAERRGALREAVAGPSPLPCSPLVHPGWWLAPGSRLYFTQKETMLATRPCPMSIFTGVQDNQFSHKDPQTLTLTLTQM